MELRHGPSDTSQELGNAEKRREVCKAIDIFEFRDGEMAQSWDVAETAGMMQQLELAPEM